MQPDQLKGGLSRECSRDEVPISSSVFLLDTFHPLTDLVDLHKRAEKFEPSSTKRSLIAIPSCSESNCSKASCRWEVVGWDLASLLSRNVGSVSCSRSSNRLDNRNVAVLSVVSAS